MIIAGALRAQEPPRGTIISQPVELEAPEEACIAYYERRRERVWTLVIESRTTFLESLTGTRLSAPVIHAIADPARWTELRPNVFEVRPPVDLLARLTGRERAELYFILAHWPDNGPERWPLVFENEAAFKRLIDDGVPEPLARRVRELSYSYPGGFAFSDFSVVAAEFPERDALLHLLQTASRVRSIIPRLRVSTALNVSQVLDYWTVEHANPYAQPLLEALLETNLPNGVDLISVLPGPPRVLSYELDPDEVTSQISINTYLISASLALPPHPVGDLDSVFRWLRESFEPTTAPLKYGDMLVLTYPPGEDIVAYACGFVVNDLVFARDPVGLGLWRFMTTEEILRRNPHFEGAHFQTYRAKPRGRNPAASPSP